MSLRSAAAKLYRTFFPLPVPELDLKTFAVMDAVLKPVSNAIDIGANRGEILAQVLKRAPQGAHWAFEPLPSLYPELARKYPNVECRQIALSDQAGTAAFHWFPKIDGFSGLQRRKIEASAQQQSIEVQVETARLDEVRDPGLPLQFIKVVEGAEYKVFRGAEETLRRQRP